MPDLAADAARPQGRIPAHTVAGVRREIAAKLRAAGTESPELDARILLSHALRLDHAGLAAFAARGLSSSDMQSIGALVRRRLAREPVARILGKKEFWSLELRIDPDCLVPRPETETVVQLALDLIDARSQRYRPLRVADLGTGSGAMLLALLSELPNAFGVGTDISLGALLVARANAWKLGLRRAAFVGCDMAAALSGPFDLIVANPPYVASGDIAKLAPEVRDFDPRQALDGGSDGLDFYRTIAAVTPPLLAAGGALVVEIGAGQSPSVTALFSAAGLAVAPARTDLNNVPRALLATMQERRP